MRSSTARCRAVAPNGFARWATSDHQSGASPSRMSPCPVTTNAFTEGCCNRIRETSSSPVIDGIRKSVMIRSSCGVWFAMLSASKGSRARESRKPLSARPSAFKTVASSSTITTCFTLEFSAADGRVNSRAGKPLLNAMGSSPELSISANRHRLHHTVKIFRKLPEQSASGEFEALRVWTIRASPQAGQMSTTIASKDSTSRSTISRLASTWSRTTSTLSTSCLSLTTRTTLRRSSSGSLQGRTERQRWWRFLASFRNLVKVRA